MRYQNGIAEQICSAHFQLVGVKVLFDEAGDVFQLPAKSSLYRATVRAFEERVFFIAATVPENIVLPGTEAIFGIFLLHIIELENFFDISLQQAIIKLNLINDP